ncbi:phage tail tape measure protein, TP901 family, core region [Bacteroidales bacterium Barb6XT]|nr:phage tail tape measure protein, TP901 family, core region [Bacteroidales bacterium Barb6XT]
MGVDLVTRIGLNSQDFVREAASVRKSINGIEATVNSASKQIKAFAALAGVAISIKSGVSTVIDFEASISTLSAILGTTPAGVKALNDEAQRLGATTKYTASEVVGLETELAKLGFTQKEIIDSTEGVLKFAQATGAGLGEASALAGAALRAFGADSSEMNRYVSAMAISTARSALSFEKLNASMSTVAPVANAFGFTIEDTLALLGKLSDAGFDASSAATASRNILLNLADSNGKLAKELGGNVKTIPELSEALITLRNKGVDLNTTLEMTDKRSVAAFNAFLQSAEGITTLREQVTGVEEDLNQMAITSSDNVEGAMAGLSSAIEAVMLSMNEQTGATGVMKTAIDAVSDSLRNLSALIKAGGISFEKLGKAIAAVAITMGTYKAAVIAAIAAENGYTVAQIANYKCLVLVERAQKLFNATLLANPYVLATTLIVGLYTALWALKDAHDSVQKAIAGVNEIDSVDEVGKAYDEQSRKVEALADKLKELEKYKEYEGESFDKTKKAYNEELQILSSIVKKRAELRSNAAKSENATSTTTTTTTTTDTKELTDKEIAAAEKAAAKLRDAELKIQESKLKILADGYEKERGLLEDSFQKRINDAIKNGVKVEELTAAIEAEKAATLKKFDKDYNEKRERINLDNRLASVENGSKEELDLTIALLEQQRKAEIEEAEKTGADVLAINNKWGKKIGEAKKDNAKSVLEKRQRAELLTKAGSDALLDKQSEKLEDIHSKGGIGNVQYDRLKDGIEYAKKYGDAILKVKHLEEDLIGLEGQDRENKLLEIDNARTERDNLKKPKKAGGFTEQINDISTTYGNFDEAISGIDGMVSALDRLHNAFDPEQEASAWEKLMAVWGAMGQVTDTIDGINKGMATMQPIIEGLTAAKEADLAMDNIKTTSEIANESVSTASVLAGEGAKTAATEGLTAARELLEAVNASSSVAEISGEAASTGIVVAGETAKTAAHQTSAVAGAIKWVMETIPPPFNFIAAGAAIAGVIALFSQIPKFATGGVVGGSSFTGDNLLARVNSGEVILNKEQQGSIYNSITNGGSTSGGGDVRFEISGTKLVGVLANINRQQGKRS